MRDTKKLQHSSRPHPSTGWSGTQFSKSKSAVINDPERPENIISAGTLMSSDH
jgi:hypothetical protein